SKSVRDPILLLGAGGVSRAILYALCKMGHKEIHLCNRTMEKALQVKEDFSQECEIIVESFENLKGVLKGMKTFINGTSIGMFGESFDLSIDDLSHLSLVYDVVYNYTPLQEMAKKVGIVCVDGKAFWFHQAVENLRIWGIYEEKIFTECFEQIVGAES
ncbi:MAG: shikimate dehydrogenase, partial [Candidatus Hydrothermia bacterium]